MTQKNDGGPAFPGFDPDSEAPKPTNGMSLRDWFAGQALAGMCGHPDGLLQTREGDLLADARLAYRLADAMLRAREGGDA